jgi:alkaline phosphatase D
MKTGPIFIWLLFLALGCTPSKAILGLRDGRSDFTLAFGSCNRSEQYNPLWDEVLALDPDLWIWGGDNIYADTDDMEQLERMYREQDRVKGYARLKNRVPIIGTWDDHDYGLNDGGENYTAKRESQQKFLDFMDVPQDSPRRARKGVYTSHEYKLPNGNIKIFVLDTRYFRTALTPAIDAQKRHQPNNYGDGTILGREQWAWLEDGLKNSTADFNILVSSVQFLSREHGFECWGNFPHEVDRLMELIKTSKAKGVIILSGDRHISEFSRMGLEPPSYPLIDFTSSGLTHVYSSYSGEPNRYRVGEVAFEKSFGLLEFHFEDKQVHFKMIGDNGKVLGTLDQRY